jgi:hypothetical protein
MHKVATLGDDPPDPAYSAYINNAHGAANMNRIIERLVAELMEARNKALAVGDKVAAKRFEKQIQNARS